MQTNRKSEWARCAAAIRKKLKRNGIKASVTSKAYSGGTSVHVEIKQDILPGTLDAIKSHCNQYVYGTFDGMSYNYDNKRADLPQVRHLFVNVEYSPEIYERAYQWLHAFYGGYEDLQGSFEDNKHNHVNGESIQREVENILYTYGRFSVNQSFWTNEKQHIRA